MCVNIKLHGPRIIAHWLYDTDDMACSSVLELEILALYIDNLTDGFPLGNIICSRAYFVFLRAGIVPRDITAEIAIVTAVERANQRTSAIGAFPW